MHSARFGLPVVVTRHAAQRMSGRSVSSELPLQLLEHGTVRAKDDMHFWVWSDIPGRSDNSLCHAVVVEKEIIVKDRADTSEAFAMKTTYFEDDDTLVIRLSDKPIVREVSQDWHTHVSYAADDSVVETVVLEAARIGAWPLHIEHRQAA